MLSSLLQLQLPVIQHFTPSLDFWLSHLFEHANIPIQNLNSHNSVKSVWDRTHSMMSPRASYQMCNRAQMVWEDAKQLALQWFINTHKYCWGPACNHRRYMRKENGLDSSAARQILCIKHQEERWTLWNLLKALRCGDCRSAKRCNHKWQLIIKEGENTNRGGSKRESTRRYGR
jgi:hypothetical protein